MGLLSAIQDPQFQQDVGRGLLDSANRGAVAGLLGGPVDLLSLALRPFGYSVEKPVMGSEWIGQKMQDAGLVSPNRNALAEALAGIALPAGAARSAPALFNAEQAAARNLAAPQAINSRMRNQFGGALVKPLGSGSHYGVDSLAEYTPTLYRETSIDRATEFLPNTMSHPQTLWFANEPAYALGQGPNRGVMMAFDAKGIPGQLSLQKPMARQQYEAGNAEFISRDADAAQIGRNLQSIRIAPDQQRGPYFTRIKGLLKDWSVTKDADGTLVFSKP